MVPKPVTQTAQQMSLGEQSLRMEHQWQPGNLTSVGGQRVCGRVVGECWQGQWDWGF